MRELAHLLGLVLLTGKVAPAQQVVLQNTTGDSAVVVLSRILERGDFLLVERDTTIGSDQTVPRDLILLGARLNLEGRIDGAVAVVEGELFLRPRSEIAGEIAVLGVAGAYPSALSTHGGVVELDRRVGIGYERRPNQIVVQVRPPPGPSVLRLRGMYGLGLPSYERVNGLSLFWGPELAFGGRDTAVVSLRPTLAYRSARGRLDGSFALSYRPGARSLLTLAAARRTRTTDTWIRADLANSLSSIGVRSDVRDYFETDEVALTVRRLPPPPLIEGEGYLVPALSAAVSRDRSLRSRDPWSLLDSSDGWRVNPAIDAGVIASVVGRLDGAWLGPTTRAAGGLSIEWAPEGIGDHAFVQLSAIGDWSMQALWGHEIELSGYLLQTLGNREAPLQRWSFVGGAGTLPTLETASLRGDRLFHLRSIYLAPIRRIQLPLVGNPALRLEHDIGAAWRTGDRRARAEQNLGIGVQLFIVHATWFVDPSERPRRAVFTIGARLPGQPSLPTF